MADDLWRWLAGLRIAGLNIMGLAGRPGCVRQDFEQRWAAEGVGAVSDEQGRPIPDPVGGLRALPIDPDVDEPESPPRRRPASRWPRLAPGVLVAVFLGGVLGGAARYGIGLAAPPSVDGFPWDIFAINLSGAFVLSVLLVLVLEVFPPTRYVRPALGTGFIGAFTTFSSLATATDHLLAHGHPMLAIAYTLGSLFGGLVAASLGLVCGRAISANRHRARTPEGVPS